MGCGLWVRVCDDEQTKKISRSPEKRSVVHAFGDERALVLHLLLDLLERVLLRHGQISETARHRHVIRVGHARRECRCACGCGCGCVRHDGVVGGIVKIVWSRFLATAISCFEIEMRFLPRDSKIDGERWLCAMLRG